MSDPNAPTPPNSGEEGEGRRPQDHPMRPDLPAPGATPAPTAYPPPPPTSPYPQISDPAYAPPSNPYADPVANPYYGVNQPYRGEAAAGMPEPYAHWGRRVGAYLLDIALTLPFVALMFVGIALIGNGTSTDPVTNQTTLGSSAPAGFVVLGLAWLASVAFSIWNQIIRQGRRGASLGKQWMQIVVVSERDGRPIGALMTFLRAIVHVVDAIPCYLGYLWPLWDAKRQTFADKIMTTVVLHLPPL